MWKGRRTCFSCRAGRCFIDGTISKGGYRPIHLTVISGQSILLCVPIVEHDSILISMVDKNEIGNLMDLRRKQYSRQKIFQRSNQQEE